MKKRIIATLMALTLTMASSLTAFAAPEKTADGGVFDAEYYAQNNPDVVSVFGTTDKNVLYNHFVLYGVKEGRLPFAPGTDWQSILNSDTAATVGTSTSTTTTTTTTNKSTNTSTTTCPYQLYTIYDEGGYNMYFYMHHPFKNKERSDANKNLIDELMRVLEKRMFDMQKAQYPESTGGTGCLGSLTQLTETYDDTGAIVKYVIISSIVKFEDGSYVNAYTSPLEQYR